MLDSFDALQCGKCMINVLDGKSVDESIAILESKLHKQIVPFPRSQVSDVINKVCIRFDGIKSDKKTYDFHVYQIGHLQIAKVLNISL